METYIKMIQTRLESIIEIVTSKVLGVVLGMLVLSTVGVFILDTPISLGQNLLLSSILAIVSITKNYFIRRYHNKLLMIRLKEALEREEGVRVTINLEKRDEEDS